MNQPITPLETDPPPKASHPTAKPSGNNRGGLLKRASLMVLGWVCVALGVAGAVLPVMPTTPFLLVALWAFARSSPRFRQWLWDHPVLGRYVRDWTAHRVIPIKAKVLALAMMCASLAWVVFATAIPVYGIAAIAVILAGAAAFILSRPSRAIPR